MRIAIIAALFAQLITPAPKPGHAAIAPSPAEVNGQAGGKLSLFVDVTPKPGIHVYAPGSNDYIPITIKLSPVPEAKAGKVAYPKSTIMTFADEKVPVFEKPFRLTQDVTLDKSLKPGATVTIAGTVNYQACDDRVCYPPESAPVSWTVTVK
jgi:DsbC/DsbD-like thiol-disulfide interchange protein